MTQQSTVLVFGATGGTGQHFVNLALKEGRKVRALVRSPAKVPVQDPDLSVQQGSIDAIADLDRLVAGVDSVVLMLGDVRLQCQSKINAAFVAKLVRAMRRQGVTRILYQAGGLSRPYKGQLSPVLWTIRNTIARGYIGQHEDNEAVMRYLVEEADDIEWIVHRAGIGSNGPSKGVLQRSTAQFSIATFRDCAAYNLSSLGDRSAIHTCDLSCYVRG